MKKQETTTPLMDEIIFEKRNKMYGAYILRKMYNRQVNKALLLSIGILIAGLAYPIARSYNAKGAGTHVWNEPGTVVMTNDPPPENPQELPQAPPDNSEIQRQVRFVTPDVVDGEVLADEGLFNQDILNQSSSSEPVDLKVEKYVEKPLIVTDDPVEKQETFITAEEMPFYTGGETERLKFLSDNIKYPQQASELGIQGTVYLQFVVDSKGNITDVKIMRGIGGGCEEEALRVIKMMPAWHPGKQNGKAVRVLYTMPVSFKLQG